MWQQAQYFPQLKIPENDKHIILSFHFYSPFAITHYRACWIESCAKYIGPINYPGNLIPVDYLQSLTEGSTKQLILTDYYNDKETLRERMRPAIEYAKKHNLELYCGEWGTINNLPRTPRINWYHDVSQIFQEEHITHAVWSYKSVFGIRSDDGTQIDHELIETILHTY
jgi:endoglucanase